MSEKNEWAKVEDKWVNTDIDTGRKNSYYDEYLEKTARYVIETGNASVGSIQRLLKIGFNRAARILDQLEMLGVVGGSEGTRTREVLMRMDEWEELWFEMQ